jgi:C_GCAxxG_C_C family probable redox protein
MEELGLGNMEIVKALSPFPGIGASGQICGAVSGALAALGLYFGSDDLLNYEANGAAMSAAREFLRRFESAFGTLECSDIQTLILGRYMDPRASKENFEAFVKAKGYEKCSLVAGIGARIAAEVIIDSMGKSS